MLTKEERDEIGARYTGESPETWVQNSLILAHARQDIPALLNALEQQDFWEEEVHVWRDKYKEAEADRDRWKARAEALERAVTYIASDEDDDLCELQLCEIQCATCRLSDECPRGDETPLPCSDWVFDEARFAGKEDADE